MQKTLRGRDYSLPETDYQSLLKRISEAGYSQRNYLAHILVFLISILGLAFCSYLTISTDNFWIQVGNASLAAFFTVQLGLIGHDLSHSSVFPSRKLNRNLALLVWGLGCGLSESRWFHKHNAHHQSPNHIGHDPDLEIPFVFSHEQGVLRGDFEKKYIFPQQHTLFWIGLWFVYPYNILNSMKFLLRDLNLHSLFEIIFMVLHFLIVLSFTFYLLPVITAITFNLVVLFVMGAYMGIIFAPNHKGEDMLSPEQKHNWVHQITLTRNIKPFLLSSFLLGGLDYQIEHHLFPTMSRFKYPQASKTVMAFCQEKNIPYKQTSWIESLKQIHLSLREESFAWKK